MSVECSASFYHAYRDESRGVARLWATSPESAARRAACNKSRRPVEQLAVLASRRAYRGYVGGSPKAGEHSLGIGSMLHRQVTSCDGITVGTPLTRIDTTRLHVREPKAKIAMMRCNRGQQQHWVDRKVTTNGILSLARENS